MLLPNALHNLEGMKGAYCQVVCIFIYYGVNLFTMPRMQHVVYMKLSEVLASINVAIE